MPDAVRNFLFTSESVTEGHPDKIADQISDSVLDAVLAEDPLGRVACETLVTTGLVVVAGEITTETYVDIPRLVRSRIREIGYDRAKYGFDAETCGVIVAIDEQSPDIAQGVDESYEVQHDADRRRPARPDRRRRPGDDVRLRLQRDRGADAAPDHARAPHRAGGSRRCARRDVLPYLRPDGKAQVTVRYEVDAHGHQRPVEIERVLVSTQHRDGLDVDVADQAGHRRARPAPDPSARPLRRATGSRAATSSTSTRPGASSSAGPMGDTGVTGRKIIVDTYGGMARHGGGAFSGKDPTKVDRSAAYAARYVAKNVVAAGLADRCELQVAYAIGVAHPISIEVELLRHRADPDPAASRRSCASTSTCARRAIVRDLDLRRPIYAKTAAYGHFGRSDEDFTWERTDKADALRAAAGLAQQVPA